MAHDFVKSVSDPIYGTIPLTELELRIIDTEVFQRLRHVEQLGLANYVFPSADYSRFAHSIGACHTIGHILDHLGGTTEEDWQLRRAAMLLHDVGHYFMSHAAEYALEAHAKSRASLVVPDSIGELPRPTAFEYVDHEQVGKLILEHDPELAPLVAAIPAGDEKPADIMAAMFKGALEVPLGSLVSSELDADRLDYLMRSAQATGLPYGHFDRDYIIQNLTVDDGGRVCLKSKAIRAADHYVMCRSFDYLQVIFHKTVVGFEEMLKRCIRHLVEQGALKMAKTDVTTAIEASQWHRYTDAYLMGLIEDIADTAPAKIVAMRDRVVKRRRARLMWSHEELIASKKSDLEDEWFQRIGHYFPEDAGGWQGNCIYWFKYFRPTDASPFQTTYAKEGKAEENKEKSIHILGKNGKAKPLTEWKESFTRHQSNQAYVMVRIYYVGPEADAESTYSSLKTLASSLRLSDGLREG